MQAQGHQAISLSSRNIFGPFVYERRYGAHEKNVLPQFTPKLAYLHRVKCPNEFPL
jgi:hypothetical protein